MLPQLSIVIPTYERSSELILSLEVLKNQTFQDFEVIIVDDSPIGPEKETIASYCADSYTYVSRTLVDFPSRPVASARSCGAAMARGNLVMWMDQDMLLHSKCLAKIIYTHSVVSNCVVWPYVGMVNFSYEDFKQSGHGTSCEEIDSLFGQAREATEALGPPYSTTQDIFITKKCFASPCPSMLRCDFMRVNPWDGQYPGYSAEDVDMAAQLMRHSFNHVRLSDAWGYHLLHSLSRYSREDWKKARSFFEAKWGYQPKSVDPFCYRERIKQYKSVIGG